MTKAKQLRNALRGNKLIKVAGAHNALGAQLIEKAGFDAVWASGLEISASRGVPDANILTMTDFLDAAIDMNGATNIPIIADCDTGFGNSNNVIHMVRKYEAAGIAAVCIEDKQFPKVNSFISGRQELSPVSEFVGKILAAKNAQATKDFIVIARTEALIAGWGMDQAVKRANSYVDAGADAILIHSKLKTFDEIAEFSKLWNKKVPLIVVPTTFYRIHTDDLERAKVKMVIYANHGLRASIRAMQNVFHSILKEGTTASIEDTLASLHDVFELQGMHKMRENEQIYANPGNDKVTAVIPVAGDHLGEYSMEEISQDIPIAMLDINGKPLLQHQVEVLNRCKISDIRVVGGYKAEKIHVDGVMIVHNRDYMKTGILFSIMCGLKSIRGPALVIYGDVLFDHFLIKKVLECASDIVLAVDTTFNESRKTLKKNCELVITNPRIAHGKRTLHRDRLHVVSRIGGCVKKTETNLEFCGIMYLSAKGLTQIQDSYKKYTSSEHASRLAGLKGFDMVSLSDFLQLLIKDGLSVQCVDVNSGWLEINSMDDYKLACSTFK